MTPDVGLAAFDTGVKVIELLIFIINTSQRLRKLRAECDEVNNTTATILKEALEANKGVLKEQKTAIKLEKVLQELAKFVVECKESNIWHRAWEVTWKNRLPGLLKEVMTWIALVNIDTTVSDFALLINSALTFHQGIYSLRSVETHKQIRREPDSARNIHEEYLREATDP